MINRIAYYRAMVALVICATTVSVAEAQGPNCVRGKANAPIRIEVFSDYQCPACRAFYLQTMKLVFANYADTGKVCVMYRAFPNFPYSRDAARFARAALRVGAPQWGMVSDALFQTQPEWSQSGAVAAIVASAVSAKDMELINKYADDPLLDDAIDEDIVAGSDLEVTSTPTFFITARGKSEKVEAALTYAAMQRRLDDLLK
jgi:protein-disulfide isomerase